MPGIVAYAINLNNQEEEAKWISVSSRLAGIYNETLFQNR